MAAATASASSLVLPSLNPQNRRICYTKPTSFSVFSLYRTHKLQAKPISVSPIFVSSTKKLASRFVRNVSVSETEEEVLSDEGDAPLSPDLKLFVGNLPFNVDSAQLAALFETAGTVEMVEVIYDKETGRSRGFAFVTMSTAQEVEAAEQQFNGYELEGRALRVNSGPPPPKEDSFSRAPRGNSSYGSSNRVYVGNLSWGVDNAALGDLFSEQGNVVEAKVVYDRDSGRSRGFGFVTYNSAEEVNNAIESLNGVDLDGRPIRVSAAEARPPRRF